LNGTIVGAVVEGGTIVGAVVKRDVPNEGARVTGNAAGWSGGGGLDGGDVGLGARGGGRGCGGGLGN